MQVPLIRIGIAIGTVALSYYGVSRMISLTKTDPRRSFYEIQWMVIQLQELHHRRRENGSEHYEMINTQLYRFEQDLYGQRGDYHRLMGLKTRVLEFHTLYFPNTTLME